MDEVLTIGEVAARTGVATSALRFYEEEGLLAPSRTAAGHRRYRRDLLRRVSAGWRDRLDDRIAALERLRDRLDGCIGCGCLSLEQCSVLNPDDAAAARGPGPHRLLEP